MSDELKPIALPPATATATALDAYKGPRHPALMRGRLQGHWSPREQKTKKADEVQQQAKNARDYLKYQHQENQISQEQVLQAIHERQRALVESQGTGISDLELVLESRMVLGFGLPNILKTGFLMHPLYGVPYLPGSAIKGVTQTYLLTRWAAEAGIPRFGLRQMDEWAKARLGAPPLERLESVLLAPDKDVTARWTALQCKIEMWEQQEGIEPAKISAARTKADDWAGEGDNFKVLRARSQFYTTLFGHQGQRGKVFFLDSFPDPEHLRFAADVLTPHYSPYYTQGSGAPIPPGDYHDPIPIPFLAVERGTRFKVRLIVAQDTHKKLPAMARDAVRGALTRRGIGSKTNSGYGIFSVRGMHHGS